MSHPGTGDRVSHYELVRKLGAGGMGQVFLAQDLRLNRAVAIKFLNSPGDETARLRLLKEARSAASLDHPFICTVHEVDSDEACGDYIVMQYVEGETLAHLLARGPLTPAEALSVASDIAEALAAAHHSGIVHRDLKPHNIVMTKDGRPKLLDFGLSKRVMTEHEAAEAQTEPVLTQARAMVGTPSYMSPEQAQGQPADFRSDLYALGCVLFECLTGHRAFVGANTVEVLGRVLHVDPPPPSSICPDVPHEVDLFVARLLHKEPAGRIQSAEEALETIRALRGESGSNPTAPLPGGWLRNVWRRPAFRGALAGLVVIVIGATVAGWWRGGALPEPPPGAVLWYDQGVEALREGVYSSARSALEEAVGVFPQYAQAYSRLAEACSELDDDGAARLALVRVSSLVPDVTRLPEDDRLRLTAVQASVMREHQQAIDAFNRLVDRHPEDAGLWLDLGRAEEASGDVGSAREHYLKAVELDPQYAAAHLRLGMAEGQTGSTERSLAAFDEAIRLYRAGSRTEGEAEAWLRKGMRQTTIGDYEGARTSLGEALKITGDARYLPLRLRSRFALSRVMLSEGQYDEARTFAASAIDEATAADADSLAAEGMVNLATILTALQQYDDADAQLEQAIQLTSSAGAGRSEMRARLQQASLRIRTNQAEDALALAQAPMAFFAEGKYLRYEAQAKSIMSRAYERLERYDEARGLASEVLQYADEIHDDSLMSESLYNLAGQLTQLGRLPEALEHRRRLEELHRRQQDHLSLSYDLPNSAELLITLGRGDEAETPLEEVEMGAARGIPAYTGILRRVTALRILRAVTEGRFEAVEPLAAEVVADGAEARDSYARLAIVLREYARARLGRSRVTPDVIEGWLEMPTSRAEKRALSYWVARTLVARHAPTLAEATVSGVLEDPIAADNLELSWRLKAVARQAGATPRDGGPSGTTGDDADRLAAAWGDHAGAYFARKDLTELRSSR
jgi:tetratricopeptide (TPR) repeat protein